MSPIKKTKNGNYIDMDTLFGSMEKGWLVSEKLFLNHTGLMTGLLNYTPLDVFHQGVLAGQELKAKKKMRRRAKK